MPSTTPPRIRWATGAWRGSRIWGASATELLTITASCQGTARGSRAGTGRCVLGGGASDPAADGEPSADQGSDDQWQAQHGGAAGASVGVHEDQDGGEEGQRHELGPGGARQPVAGA